eukprot:1138175-Pelagomonas_calceolata.AAC.3
MIIQKPDGDLHSKVHGNYFEASYGWSTSLMPHSAFTFRVRLAFKDSRIICRASSLMHALGPLCFFILDAPSLEEVTHHLQGQQAGQQGAQGNRNGPHACVIHAAEQVTKSE